MTHTKTLLVALALAVAVPLSGCIENMSDLKERLGATEEAVGETLESAALAAENASKAANLTMGNKTKMPVARVTVFGPGGVLVYKAGFAAENVTTIVTSGEGEFTFLSEDSEVLQPGATLASFTWTVGTQTLEGRKATATLTPGVYPVHLKVTDSKGGSDTQAIMLGVTPTPFVETVDLTGGPTAGVAPAPTARTSQTFTVKSEKDGKALQVLSLNVRLHGTPSGDTILFVADPSGNETSADANAVNAAELISYSTGAAGQWTVSVEMFAGVAHEWIATVEVTYVEIVPGLAGGDGHGGHAGH